MSDENQVEMTVRRTFSSLRTVRTGIDMKSKIIEWFGFSDYGKNFFSSKFIKTSKFSSFQRYLSKLQFRFSLSLKKILKYPKCSKLMYLWLLRLKDWWLISMVWVVALEIQKNDFTTNSRINSSIERCYRLVYSLLCLSLCLDYHEFKGISSSIWSEAIKWLVKSPQYKPYIC